MVRPPSFDSNGIKKGAWNAEEDNKLRDYVLRFGHANWQMVPILAGLARCGKSCRLRWLNYLKPGLKRGKFTKQEEDLIIKLHAQIGSKWSIMATHLPGRTDNEIKNYWHAHIKKRRPNKINIAPDEDHIRPVENPDHEISIATAATADDPYFPSLIPLHEEQLYYDQYYSSSGSNYQYQPVLEEEDDAIFYVVLW